MKTKLDSSEAVKRIMMSIQTYIMRLIYFPVFAFGCYILTVAYASPDVTDVVQKVGSQCYIVALPIK